MNSIILMLQLIMIANYSFYITVCVPTILRYSSLYSKEGKTIASDEVLETGFSKIRDDHCIIGANTKQGFQACIPEIRFETTSENFCKEKASEYRIYLNGGKIVHCELHDFDRESNSSTDELQHFTK